jgi:acetoin utilization deacetylase AcuC-like enzyme
LEGGYHLEGLRQSVRAVLQESTGRSLLTPEETREDGRPDLPVVQRVWSVQKNFWNRD